MCVGVGGRGGGGGGGGGAEPHKRRISFAENTWHESYIILHQLTCNLNAPWWPSGTAATCSASGRV